MPFGEVESGFDLVEGEPLEFSDFVFLTGGDLRGVFGAGEKEDDGFDDVKTRDVVGEGVASRFVEDDGEAGFFFDFAEGGFEFGFAGFDMAFRKAGETIVLVDDEDFTVMDDDGAAGGFGNGVLRRVVDGMGGGEVRNILRVWA